MPGLRLSMVWRSALPCHFMVHKLERTVSSLKATSAVVLWTPRRSTWPWLELLASDDMSEAVFIVGIGACTPVSRSAWASAAAVHAGISGFSPPPI